jgi:fatty acid desaturase
MANPTTHPVEPLPACILGAAANLSSEVKAQIKAVSGPRPIPFLLSAVLSWTTIFLLIYAAETVSSIWFTIPVLFLIASRQMALAYLMHEQTHHLAFNSKYGDLITNLIACYPLLLVTVENYAQVHLPHHRHFFEDPDPDFHRKSGDIWAQPMPRKQLIRLFMQDLFGFSVLKYFKGKKMGTMAYQRRWVIPGWVKPVYLLMFAVLFTWQGWWLEFLLYWILPLFTFFQVISRLGALCEHRYNLPAARLEDSTPMIILPWWQKMLIPDLNFHYHVYHHYFPGVSFTSLPKVHAIYEREGFVNGANVYRGYFDYFRRAIIKPD